jgi:hypothetical protein
MKSKGTVALVEQDRKLLAGVQKDLANQSFTINDKSCTAQTRRQSRCRRARDLTETGRRGEQLAPASPSTFGEPQTGACIDEPAVAPAPLAVFVG